MEDSEYDASEQFKRAFIQPRIIQDWYANDSALLQSFLQRTERYRPPAAVSQHWAQLLQEQQVVEEQEAVSKRQVELRNIRVHIERFHKDVAREAARQQAKLDKQTTRSGGGGSSKTKSTRHCDFLPTQFATDVVSWNA